MVKEKGREREEGKSVFRGKKTGREREREVGKGVSIGERGVHREGEGEKRERVCSGGRRQGGREREKLGKESV